MSISKFIFFDSHLVVLLGKFMSSHNLSFTWCTKCKASVLNGGYACRKKDELLCTPCATKIGVDETKINDQEYAKQKGYRIVLVRWNNKIEECDQKTTASSK